MKSVPVRTIFILHAWQVSIYSYIQAKFDVGELHRHADFAPKKQAAPPPAPPKREQEDDLLPPPRPVEPAKSSNATTNVSFDGDGEFGSGFRCTMIEYPIY